MELINKYLSVLNSDHQEYLKKELSIVLRFASLEMLERIVQESYDSAIEFRATNLNSGTISLDEDEEEVFVNLIDSNLCRVYQNLFEEVVSPKIKGILGYNLGFDNQVDTVERMLLGYHEYYWKRSTYSNITCTFTVGVSTIDFVKSPSDTIFFTCALYDFNSCKKIHHKFIDLKSFNSVDDFIWEINGFTHDSERVREFLQDVEVVSAFASEEVAKMYSEVFLQKLVLGSDLDYLDENNQQGSSSHTSLPPFSIVEDRPLTYKRLKAELKKKNEKSFSLEFGNLMDCVDCCGFTDSSENVSYIYQFGYTESDIVFNAVYFNLKTQDLSYMDSIELSEFGDDEEEFINEILGYLSDNLNTINGLKNVKAMAKDLNKLGYLTPIKEKQRVVTDKMVKDIRGVALELVEAKSNEPEKLKQSQENPITSETVAQPRENFNFESEDEDVEDLTSDFRQLNYEHVSTGTFTRPVALFADNKLIGLRFKTGNGCVDMSKDKAISLGIPISRCAKRLNLQVYNGFYLSKAEIENKIMYPDVTYNDEVCQLILKSILG